MIVSFWSFFYVPCRSDFFGIDVVFVFSPTTLLSYVLVLCYLLAIEPLLVDYDFSLALLNFGFCTLCIWVPPSLSLPITIYNRPMFWWTFSIFFNMEHTVLLRYCRWRIGQPVSQLLPPIPRPPLLWSVWSGPCLWRSPEEHQGRRQRGVINVWRATSREIKSAVVPALVRHQRLYQWGCLPWITINAALPWDRTICAERFILTPPDPALEAPDDGLLHQTVLRTPDKRWIINIFLQGSSAGVRAEVTSRVMDSAGSPHKKGILLLRKLECLVVERGREIADTVVAITVTDTISYCYLT